MPYYTTCLFVAYIQHRYSKRANTSGNLYLKKVKRILETCLAYVYQQSLTVRELLNCLLTCFSTVSLSMQLFNSQALCSLEPVYQAPISEKKTPSSSICNYRIEERKKNRKIS